MRLSDIIIISLLVSIIILTTVLVFEMEEAERTCEMKFEQPNILGVNGLWHINEGEEYMCVWLDGRTTKQINETISHEFLHSLIEHDYEHFCKK